MYNPVNTAPYSYHGEYSPTVTMVNTASLSRASYATDIGNEFFLSGRQNTHALHGPPCFPPPAVASRDASFICRKPIFTMVTIALYSPC